MKRATIHLLLSGAVLAAGIVLGTPEARADEKPALRLTEKKVSVVRVDDERPRDERRREVRARDERRRDRGDVRHERKGKRTRAAVDLASRRPRVNRGTSVCVSPHCAVPAHAHGRGSPRRVMSAAARAQHSLDQLQQRSGMEIVTPSLSRMIRAAREAGAEAKVSGAGGGDCGVAFVPSMTAAVRLRRSWGSAGFPILDLRTAPAKA